MSDTSVSAPAQAYRRLWLIALLTALHLPLSASAQQATKDNFPTCSDPRTVETAKAAIEASPGGRMMGIKVVDFGKIRETWYEQGRKVRRCVAQAMLSAGNTIVTYQVITGPSGKLIVQAQYGDAAIMQNEVDKARRDEARQAGQAPASTMQAPKAPSKVVQGPKAASIEDNYSAGYHKCMSTGEAAQGVTSAMVECIGSELKLQDGKLNASYKATMASLDPAGQTNLRTAQRAWIKNRDTKCEEENQTGGTMDLIGRPSCNLDLTVRRTQELEKMRGN